MVLLVQTLLRHGTTTTAYFRVRTDRTLAAAKDMCMTDGSTAAAVTEKRTILRRTSAVPANTSSTKSTAATAPAAGRRCTITTVKAVATVRCMTAATTCAVVVN